MITDLLQQMCEFVRFFRVVLTTVCCLRQGQWVCVSARPARMWEDCGVVPEGQAVAEAGAARARGVHI